MPKNILEEIIKKKLEKIDILKKSTSLNSLTDIIDKNNSFLNFKKKIQSNLLNNKTSIIAEIKKASPSAGVIIQNYHIFLKPLNLQLHSNKLLLKNHYLYL